VTARIAVLPDGHHARQRVPKSNGADGEVSGEETLRTGNVDVSGSVGYLLDFALTFGR